MINRKTLEFEQMLNTAYAITKTLTQIKNDDSSIGSTPSLNGQFYDLSDHPNYTLYGLP